MPNIKHELLYEVFIPDFETFDEDRVVPKNSSTACNFYEKLEYESYKLTGNLKESITTKVNRWTPSGRITVLDDLLGTIPLVGANVHARWCTHIASGITNNDGRFSMGNFIFEVNYSIKWERYNYSIRSGTVGQAWYNGPKKKGEWIFHIGSGVTKFYATIHRGAHHYYYGSIGGIKRPPQNAFFQPQMKIAAINEVNNDTDGRHNASLRILGLFNWIKIWNPQNSSDIIYATAIHELGHASHWEMNHSKYNDSSTKVKESWATGIEWSLTRMTYPNYPPFYFGNYTGIVEDMIDGISGYDQVCCYTMVELENAIKNQTTWNAWRDNIINKYNNATEANLPALFNHW